MTCNTCGDWDVVDVWGRADWYSAASKVCTICRAIPRTGHGPDDATLAKFGLARETYAAENKYVQCPECGVTYWFYYHEWLEDWQSESRFAFTRLDIAQTLEGLPAEDKPPYAEQIPKIVEELELNLFSQHGFDRAEAAWKLSRYYHTQNAFEKLRRLLTHKADDIFAEAFVQSFRRHEDNDDPEPAPAFEPQALPERISGPAMLRGLHSGSNPIKELATRELCEGATRSGDSAAILRLLQSHDTHVAEHALWYLTYRAQVLEIKPLRNILIQFVKSGNAFQATCALKLLRAGRKDGADPVPPFRFIRECLKHKKVEIRKEAVEQIFSWAASKNEKQLALKILVRLLKDRQLKYDAMEQLRNQAEFGEKEIAIVIPDVITHVKKKKYRWEDGLQILRSAMTKKIDISGVYPFITKSIAAADRRAIESSSIIVDLIIATGTDMSSFRKDLEAGLAKMQADYYGEQLLKLLVRIYLRAKDYPALTKLVHHANTSVQLFATAALREAIDSSPGNSEAVKILESMRRIDAD